MVGTVGGGWGLGVPGESLTQGASGNGAHAAIDKVVSHTPAACSFPGENARSWEALGEARPGQSSLSAGALRLGWEDPLEKG